MRVRLVNGGIEVELAPDLGGRVTLLRHGGRDVLVPMGTEPFDPDHWPKAGAYPLIPFHNRVFGARLAFGDRVAHLPVHPESAPHALHGMTNRFAWEIETCSETAATMRFDWAASSVWPWSFRAWQQFELTETSFVLTLLIENRDSVPMPAGLGWHPYFTGPLNMTEDASRLWPMGADYLPTGQSRNARPVDAEMKTRYLSDWRRVAVHWAGGASMELSARGLPHLVIHAPDSRYTCIEPVSHLAGFVDHEIEGMSSLSPDAILTSQIRLCFGV